MGFFRIIPSLVHTEFTPHLYETKWWFLCREFPTFHWDHKDIWGDHNMNGGWDEHLMFRKCYGHPSYPVVIISRRAAEVHGFFRGLYHREVDRS